MYSFEDSPQLLTEEVSVVVSSCHLINENFLFMLYFNSSQGNSISLAFRILPGMETPLDVLSRAASLVHADDEKRKSQVKLSS